MIATDPPVTASRQGFKVTKTDTATTFHRVPIFAECSHDELVFDMHKDETDVLPPLVEEEMKTAIPLSVPIVVELGTGDNWLVAH